MELGQRITAEGASVARRNYYGKNRRENRYTETI